MRRFVATWAWACLVVFFSDAAFAIDSKTLHDLAFGESDDKLAAIGALTAAGGAEALNLLQALRDGEVQTAGQDQVLFVKGETAIDLATGKAISPLPESRDDVVINNRVRKGLETAIAAFKLGDPDRALRLASAKQLQNGAEEPALPAIEAALARETDSEIKDVLSLTRASVQLGSKDKPARMAAIRALADSNNPATKTLLLGIVEKQGQNF